MAAGPDERQQALNEIGGALRTLAANLIDIVRGAGKPLQLSLHVDTFVAALGDFERSMGHPKARELAEMLRVDIEPKGPAPKSEEEMAELYAQHAIVQASLRLATARLLGQETEAAEALAELHAALTGFEDTKRRIEKRRDEAEKSNVASRQAPETTRRSR
jgi:hypothetical protein